MKYVLDEKYDLCGWKLVPYAIKDKGGNVEFLNKAAFNTLYACEGKVVLNEGKVAEIGTCDEFIKKNGMFCDLINAENS